MKRSVRWLALICALMMTVSLFACGEKKDDAKSGSDAAAVDLTDFGWVKFEMPEGWADAKESDAYVTVKEDADTHHIVKLFGNNYVVEKTIEEVAKADAADNPDRYTLDAPVEIGGREWYPVRFKFNDKDSVRLFAEVDKEHYCYVTVFEQTETAPAVQTILNNIAFDASKF